MMSQIMTPDLTTDEAAGIEAAIEQIFDDIDRSIEQTSREQEESRQLKAHARAQLEQLKAMLN